MVRAAGPAPVLDELEGRDLDVVAGAVAVLRAEAGASAEEAVRVLQLLARTGERDVVAVARVVLADALVRPPGTVGVTD